MSFKKTTVVNIYGPPGSGKSVLAAELYVALSKQGKSVELVRECFKRYAWAGYTPTVYEQLHMISCQMKEETALYGKVDYIITDSPIVLGEFYADYYHQHKTYDSLQSQVQINVNKLHYFLDIDRDLYNQNGRYSNLEESILIQNKMLSYITLHITDEMTIMSRGVEARAGYILQDLKEEKWTLN